MRANSVSIRFYAELNDFLPRERRGISFEFDFKGNPSIKDLVESLGVPHSEIDLILANGEPVGFSWRVENGARIGVYPVFESLDISPISRLRPVPLRETRFILDGHLGRLARYLRMAGLDASCQNNFDDDELVELAAIEKRIILTRDKGLLKRSAVTHGYWVRETDPRLQLAEIIRRFDLSRGLAPFSRCMCCNSATKPVDKKSIEHRLPPRVLAGQQDFSLCPRCNRVYWKGSHYSRMSDLIERSLLDR